MARVRHTTGERLVLLNKTEIYPDQLRFSLVNIKATLTTV